MYSYPTTYVVDKNGNIVGEPIVGAITSEKQSEKLQKLIDQAIANSTHNKLLISIMKLISDTYYKGIRKQFEKVVSVSRELEEEFLSYREIFESVIDAIEHYITDEDDVILEGQDKILNNPEYEDIEKVRNFLSVVASKDKLAGILSDGGEDVEISIKIGKEAGKDVPDDCSVVTATYSAGGVKMGTYGVIGPRRMDYQRVISVLESVGSILEAIINQK